MNTKLLRHYLAALAYRAAKAINEAPDYYPSFEAGSGVRQPIEIVNHMSNVLTYVLQSYGYKEREQEKVGTWEAEVERFYKIFALLNFNVDNQIKIRETQYLRVSHSNAPVN
jgi:hypothetical protein